MKLLLIAAIAFVALSAVTAAKYTQEEEERIFNHWLKKHGIKVPHDEAGKKWKANVIKNLEDIEAHNERYRKGEESFERSLNHLAHLDDDEITQNRLGHEDYTPDQKSVVPVITRSRRAADNLPAYWNWADKGIVQPVQQQGHCGCCYAFAATAAIEAHACKHFSQCTKLSEQESMECTRGCKGGHAQLVYDYSNDKGGLAKEKDYAFEAKTINECEADVKNNPRVANTKVFNWRYMPNDTYTIMHHLYNKGPMYVGVQMYKNFHHYSSGVFDNPKDKTGGHAILLVGYGTEKGKDYWIIKNSWGERWGENGYAKIRRGVDLMTIESRTVSYPILDPKEK